MGHFCPALKLLTALGAGGDPVLRRTMRGAK